MVHNACFDRGLLSAEASVGSYLQQGDDEIEGRAAFERVPVQLRARRLESLDASQAAVVRGVVEGGPAAPSAVGIDRFELDVRSVLQQHLHAVDVALRGSLHQPGHTHDRDCQTS